MPKNKWSFDLKENLLTTDIKDDYTAVQRKVLTLYPEDLAKLIAEERTEYRQQTITNIEEFVEEMIIRQVCQGNIVVTKAATYMPSIVGSFTAEGVVDPSVNKPQVNVVISDEFRRALTDVSLEFSGRVLEEGGAAILTVTDLNTKRTDGRVGRGHMVRLGGRKIRALMQDGSDGTVTLYNESEIGETVTELGVNDPSEIIFIFPIDLAEGKYRLEIETYFSNSTTLLKTPRKLVCPIELIAE